VLYSVQSKELASLILPTINWTQPVPAILIIAAELESIEALDVPQRIKLAQDTLEYVVEKQALTPTEKQSALFFIANVLPHVYTAVVHASSNPMVARAKAVVKNCGPSCSVA
jgi:hypothetical protein